MDNHNDVLTFVIARTCQKDEYEPQLEHSILEAYGVIVPIFGLFMKVLNIGSRT